MSSLCLWLVVLPSLHAAVPAPGSWFFPDEGPDIVRIGDGGAVLDADGRPGGLTVGVDNRVVVRADEPQVLGALAGVVSVKPALGDGHTVVVTLAQNTDPFVFSRDLHGRPGVQWAHPDLLLPTLPMAVPNDPMLVDQWYLENTGQMGGTVDVDIDAEAAWALSTGAGITVAVIDSGVDVAHSDLIAVSGRDYIDGDDDCYPDDGNGHGTAVAGIIAGVGDNSYGVAGVAWDADIYGIRLIGGDTSTADVRDAFIEATDAGAAVLNNSWGFSNGCGSWRLPAAIREGLEHAEEVGRDGKGAVVVVSAGNGDCDNSGDGLLGHPTVVGVAAVDGNDHREYYSSFGDGVDITGFAGGNIVTTDIVGDPGYGSWRGDVDFAGTFSGTSSAAPVVSGVVALMLAANPDLLASEVRDVLCASAARIDADNAEYGADGWGPWYGCGRIDGAAAVAMVANDPPATPELLGPRADPLEDAVTLQWSGADPDGDALTYTVRWSRADDAAPTEVQTTDTRLVLTGEVAAGDTVVWSVQAEDRWTQGPESEAETFDVQAIAEAPVDEADPDPEVDDTAAADPAPADDADGGAKAGCAAAPGMAGLGLAWMAGVLVWGRRRND